MTIVVDRSESEENDILKIYKQNHTLLENLMTDWTLSMSFSLSEKEKSNKSYIYYGYNQRGMPFIV